MSLIDTLNSALNFSNVATVAVKKTQEQDKTKKPHKSFASLLRNKEELQELREAGLPLELAGLSKEDAVIFLKDSIDKTGDEFTDRPTAANFAIFRKSVSQFLKYVERHNYEISTDDEGRKVGKEHIYKGVSPYFITRHKTPPYKQVKVIDVRLNEIATMILQNHSDKMTLLTKVGEIKGLIIDLLAS